MGPRMPPESLEGLTERLEQIAKALRAGGLTPESAPKGGSGAKRFDRHALLDAQPRHDHRPGSCLTSCAPNTFRCTRGIPCWLPFPGSCREIA